MSAINPYQSPAEIAGKAAMIDESAQSVFWAWERLRLWYNAVLILLTIIGLSIFGVSELRPRRLVALLAFGAMIANVGFCIGPCLEGYLAWFGARRPVARLMVFAAGTLLSCLLASIVIMSLASPFAGIDD